MRSRLIVLSAAALSVTLFSPLPSADARGARSKDGAYRTDAGRPACLGVLSCARHL